MYATNRRIHLYQFLKYCEFIESKIGCVNYNIWLFKRLHHSVSVCTAGVFLSMYFWFLFWFLWKYTANGSAHDDNIIIHTQNNYTKSFQCNLLFTIFIRFREAGVRPMFIVLPTASMYTMKIQLNFSVFSLFFVFFKCAKTMGKS